jgi:hypothetical protein
MALLVKEKRGRFLVAVLHSVAENGD